MYIVKNKNALEERTMYTLRNLKYLYIMKKIYFNPKTNTYVVRDREDESDNWNYWQIEHWKKPTSYIGTTPHASITEVENSSDWVKVQE